MIKEILAVFKNDSLMDRAFDRSYEMLEKTQAMFKTAKDVLRYSDTNDIDIDINDEDSVVNKYQRDVRKDVFNHLVLAGIEDLPSGLILVSIVIDLERIGDYTKNIVDIAKNHRGKLHGGVMEEDLIKLEEAVEVNFIRTIEIFKNTDEEAGRELIKEYKWVSKLCDDRIQSLMREEITDLTPGAAVSLAIYIRSLKRIHSHLRNVTTSVVNPFHRIGYKPKKKKI